MIPYGGCETVRVRVVHPDSEFELVRCNRGEDVAMAAAAVSGAFMGAQIKIEWKDAGAGERARERESEVSKVISREREGEWFSGVLI